MGVGGSQPAHVVEVRLEVPQAKCSGEFFARVHTAADGVSKYEAWAKPQNLGLWADDIITISICCAKNEEFFDSHRYEDFAEIYLPWELVSGLLKEDEEQAFRLSIARDAPRLGQHSSPSQYRDAFRRAANIAEMDPAAPHIRIHLKKLKMADVVDSFRHGPRDERGASATKRAPAGPAGQPQPQLQQPPQTQPPQTQLPQLQPPQPPQTQPPRARSQEAATGTTPVPRARSPKATAGSAHVLQPQQPLPQQQQIQQPPQQPSSLPPIDEDVPPPERRPAPQQLMSQRAPSLGPSQGPPQGPSQAQLYASQELDQDEMKLLLQLTVRNGELRSQLGVKDSEAPEVEQQVQEHLDQLKLAISENYDLLTQLQMVDKEFAMTTASLSEEDQLLILGQQPPEQSAAAAERSQNERVAAALMAELQSVTGSNVELINRKEEEIKKLEVDIAAAQHATKQAQAAAFSEEKTSSELAGQVRLQALELQAVRDECQRLQDSIREEECRKQEPDAKIIKELQMEHEVYAQMIESLRQKVHEQRSAPTLQPPKTTDLQNEATRLQAEIKRVQQERRQKQDIAAANSRELREETKQFEDELQRVLADRQALETETEDLKRLPAEHAQLLDRKEQLARHITRQLTRIEVWDEKIQVLSEQAGDIRQRAALVSRAGTANGLSGGAPNLGGSGAFPLRPAAAPDDPEMLAVLGQLTEVVSQLNEKVQLAQKLDEQLRRDEEKANEELRAAQVEITVTQEKTRQLKSRTKATSDWVGP